MSRSQTLYKLQEIDTEIDKAWARIEEIDRRLADDQHLQKLEEEAAALADQQLETKKILTQAEHQVEDQTVKIDQNQKKLYGGAVTNPKELADLQLEEDSLKKYLKVLEDRQLEAMIEFEQISEKVNKANLQLGKYREKYQQEQEELKAEKADLTLYIKQQQEIRSEIVSGVSEEDLGVYKKLREKLGGIAVAAMNNHSCAACGSNIPSAVEQEVKSPSKITHCTTCGRILYHTG